MFKDTYLMRPGYFWCYVCQKPRSLSNPCMHHTGDEPCLDQEVAEFVAATATNSQPELSARPACPPPTPE